VFCSIAGLPAVHRLTATVDSLPLAVGVVVFFGRTFVFAMWRTNCGLTRRNAAAVSTAIMCLVLSGLIARDASLDYGVMLVIALVWLAGFPLLGVQEYVSIGLLEGLLRRPGANDSFDLS
jgi:hypothetical protein